ncbi:aldehyde-activating protein [Diplodia corticola]|uniref:Aldehyde-activating protein n=1 Tax=Diplodia corticola TaxID=236234 RepID=A0A1J9RV96_9PEZI|nr:aldehyde-activating protein [Diplodia corticola]OJD32319.1 aldehyde-activating protein [Diplodia corticola]
MPPTHTGGCECGAVRYAFASAPVHVSLCHCASCKRSTGSTHTHTLIIPAASFTPNTTANTNTTNTDSNNDTNHTAKIYTRTSDSGREVRSHFCGACGTTMWAESDVGAAAGGAAAGGTDGGGGVLAVRAGTLDDLGLNEKEGWRPGTELYCRDRYGWMREVGGARAFEGMMEGEGDLVREALSSGGKKGGSDSE